MASSLQSGLRLRPQSSGDRPFLLQLFGQSRRAEFAALGWSKDQLDAFLYAQFKAQSLTYAQRFPGARFDIVELDALAIGRFYVAKRAAAYVIIDLTIDPAWRGRGIATRLISDLQREAAGEGGWISLQVHTGSAARRLYARSGFTTVAERGSDVQMRWPADCDSTLPGES